MKTVKMIPCEENKFQDIPNMRFFRAENGNAYFDATLLLEKNAPKTGKNIEQFHKLFEYQTKTLCDANAVTKDDVWVKDNAGHDYLHECIALPFLTYVDPWFGPYLNDRMEEMIRFGMTISDNMLQYFCKCRFE